VSTYGTRVRLWFSLLKRSNMLYYLFEFLESKYDLPGAGLFQFISFRTLLAFILSLIISIIIGNRIIRSLKRLQIGESVRDLGLEGQLEKSGTPTMGGVIILLSILVPCILLTKVDNIYIITLVVTAIWMAMIGFVDDYIKVFRKDKKGLKGRSKILGQLVLGILIGVVMLFHHDVLVRMDKSSAEQEGFKIVKELPIVEGQAQLLPSNPSCQSVCVTSILMAPSQVQSVLLVRPLSCNRRGISVVGCQRLPIFTFLNPLFQLNPIRASQSPIKLAR